MQSFVIFDGPLGQHPRNSHPQNSYFGNFEHESPPRWGYLQTKANIGIRLPLGGTG